MGVGHAWDSLSWNPRLLGLRRWRVRTPGSLERRNGGVVCRIEFLHTPKPPHGRLICNEKDVNQGVTDPRRLWNPTEEN